MTDQPNPPEHVPAPQQAQEASHDAGSIVTRAGGWLWSVLKDLPAGLLTLITLWVFTFVPGLRPWEPPQENTAAISNVAVAERQLARPDRSGVEELVVLFDIETVGYDRKQVRIATLLLDPVYQVRIGSALYQHGVLYNLTRTERSVVWLEIPYPTFDDDRHSGCAVIRVFAYEETPDPIPTLATQSAARTPLTRFTDETILAYADSMPFDPYARQGPGSCALLGQSATPEA